MSTSNSSQDSRRHLIKSTSVLSLGTLTSRVLGFVRDLVLAQVLGTGVRADAFFVAFKIPNMFRELVAEGATNAAVVPVLSEVKAKKTTAEFWSCVNVLFFWGIVILSGVTLAGVVLSPGIVRLMAPGFLDDADKLDLTIRLTRMMFPYLLLIGLAAYGMGVLYTLRAFTLPAFSSALANAVLILCALWAWKQSTSTVFILALGVLAGGLAQVSLQFYALRKQGFRWEKPRNIFQPEAVRIKQLMIPRMFGSGVYQMSVLIDTFCASLAGIVGAGGIPAIYYAGRLVQLPMGLFGVSMASTALPALSSQAGRADMPAFKKTLVFFLENIFFIMIPTTVIFLLTAQPVIRSLFERGAFDAYSTTITSSALMFYALGLTSFAATKMLVTAFYALQDTKTPVKVATLCLILTVILNFALMFPLKIGGIALANSIVS
ncbi:MAG: murein biosynthesis integral membrane protein MurJ, partial [Candidatus Omnitrophica bacterium CG12_big_fil_rev_8_21_14_0_65_50_5]